MRRILLGTLAAFLFCSNAHAGLYDMVEMTVASAPGLGTITLGNAIPPYQALTATAVITGETVSYHLQDGNNWENGRGIVNIAATTTISRGVVTSSNGNALITAGPGAVVWIAALAEDMITRQYPSDHLISQYAQPVCPLTDATTILSDAINCPWNATHPTDLRGTATNKIVLTAAGHTLALPTNLPTMGGQDIMYWIIHSGNDGPAFGTGFVFPGGPAPPPCSATVTTGCLSITANALDWLPCRSLNADVSSLLGLSAPGLGCSLPLTNIRSSGMIAFLNSANIPFNGAGSTTTSTTYTAQGGANDLLVACFAGGGPTADDLTAVTYGGTAMNFVAKLVPTDTGGTNTDILYQYYLLNPTSAAGATFLVTSNTAHGLGAGELLEYSGAATSGQPDATSTYDVEANTTTNNSSVTTVAGGDWAIVCAHNQANGIFAAGAGLTVRQSPDNFNAGFDSNGGINPAGAYSMTVTTTNGAHTTLVTGAYKHF